MTPSLRRGRTAGDIAAVLDVGTSKVTCLVAIRDSASALPTDDTHDARSAHAGGAGHVHPAARILGVGCQRSRGIKGGAVVDLGEAERSIREAIAEAEKMAGVRVEKVVLAVACGRLQSTNFAAQATLGKQPLNEADIARVMAAGQSYAERDGRRLVHLNRINWRLDGQSHIREPRGMRGLLLEADLHAVTAEEAPLRNLLIAVERAYVKVTSVVAAPFAAGIAVSTPEERRFGVTVLDMGAGTTSVAYFAEGHLLNVDVVLLGGAQITYDIARNLTISLAEAERIKTLYGTLVTAPSDEHELIPYAQNDLGNSAGRLTRGALHRLVRARFEDMLGALRERIDGNRFAAHASGRIVLTGGASQLAGCGEVAADLLRRPVRLGAPSMAAPGAGISMPPFATAVGVMQSMFVPGACVLASDREQRTDADGRYLEQVGSWLRKSF